MTGSLFNLFMFVCLYPILILFYFMLKNDTKPKKNIVLGVTLPYALLYDPQVTEICSQMLGRLRKQMIVLSVLLVPSLLVPSTSISLTIMLTWVVLAIIVPHLTYIRAYKQLRAFKQSSGEPIDAPRIVLDLTANQAAGGRVKGIWFLPAVVIGLFPLVYDLIMMSSSPDFGVHLILTVSMGFVVLLGPVLYGVLYRQRSEVIDEDSGINAALTRIKRREWSKCWLWYTYLSAGLSLLMWLMQKNLLPFGASFGGILVYTVGIIVIVIRAEFAVRRAQNTVWESTPSPAVADEDAFWIYGMLYHNPADKHLMVTNRVGMGTTINLAKPAGKIIMGFSALIVALMPLIGVWMMGLEYTPLRYEVKNDALVIRHLQVEETIPLEDITQAEQITGLPSLRRAWGTGLDNLLMGQFDAEGYGRCTLYLNPQNSAFWVLSVGERTLIVNDDPAVRTSIGVSAVYTASRVRYNDFILVD